MGLFNVNAIGAYVITVLLAALLVERRKVVVAVNALERMPTALRILLAVLLLPLALVSAAVIPSEKLSLLTIPYLLLDLFTLWVHEAGHIYFMFFGRFFHFLGGTLNELLFPGVIVCTAHLTGRPVLRALGLYWLGFNLLRISVYIADARARKLPLLGADIEGHDWHNLLSMTGLLEHDHAIAKAAHILGFLIAAASLVLLIMGCRKGREHCVR